jgi:hypothetical protein
MAVLTGFQRRSGAVARLTIRQPRRAIAGWMLATVLNFASAACGLADNDHA